MLDISSRHFLYLHNTYLKTVKARHVSVTAYQDRSIKCSNSAALNRPKNIFRITFPNNTTKTKACKYMIAMLKMLIFPLFREV